MPSSMKSAGLLRSFLAFTLTVSSSGSVRATSLIGRPREVVTGHATILSGHLAVIGGEVEVCDGVNDLLPVTFSFQVAADADVINLDPEAFEVTLRNLNDDETSTVTPKCASLAPNIESDERRTVLLLGEFTPESGVGPVKVEVVGDVSLSMPDGTETSVTGLSISQAPQGKDDFFGYLNGPIVIDNLFLEPSDATTDENGCKADFPATTNVLRLKTKSALRERNLEDTDGTEPLSNLGTDATVARAKSMFYVGTPADSCSPWRSGSCWWRAPLNTEAVNLLGIADVDMDNIVDLCLSISDTVPDTLYVQMTCGLGWGQFGKAYHDESAIVFGPDGQACAPQVIGVKTA